MSGENVVEAAATSNDDEDLAVTATVDATYFIAVTPENPEDVLDPGSGQVLRPADLNEYTLEYSLNAGGCDQDGVCGAFETNDSCPGDCPNPIFCGNMVCEPLETGCPQDCYCGNGTCDSGEGEDEENCPDDCLACM